MPASLYRLVGKPHHAEIEQSQDTVAEPQVHEVTPVESPVVADPEPTVQDQTSVPSEETSSPVTVTWDPSWTKAKLLEAAASLGLPVTSINTRAEIIEALTAATSA